MTKLSFSKILIQIGFSPNDAIRYELILDSLIAEEIRQTIDEKEIEDDESLQKIIKEKVKVIYSDYIECVTHDLNLSQTLLVKEKLSEYLETI